MRFRRGDLKSWFAAGSMGLYQTVWAKLLIGFPSILKSILLLMINYMVTLSLGNRSGRNLCGFLVLFVESRSGGEDVKNHGPHFRLPQPIPPYTTLEKSAYCFLQKNYGRCNLEGEWAES